MMWKKLGLMCFAVCLFLPGLLIAENKDDGVREMDDVVVTATKTTVDESLNPTEAYTVDRKDIEYQPSHYMNNFGEFIRDIPGVHVAQYYPWGPPWVHLRGTGHFLQRTAYLIDGVPVHAFLSAALNAEDIESVDVVLGPSSALYGASAAGGAVNIITRSGKEGDGVMAKVAYGSRNTFRPAVSVGDDNGTFNYRLSYSADISDGHHMKPVDGMLELYDLGTKSYLKTSSVEENEYEHHYVAGKLGWKNDLGTSLTFSLNYQNRYLYGGQKNYIINDNGETYISSLRLMQSLGDWGRLTATTGYQFQSIPSQANGGASLTDGRNVVVDPTISQTEDWDRRRIPFEVQADIYLMPNNVLTTGLYMAREEEDSDDFDGETGDQTYRYDLTSDMLGVYLQDQMFFMDERLSVVGGIRYDEWKYKDIYDSGSSDPTPDDVTKDHVTYRAGVKFKVNETLSLRSSGGTAFWPGNPKWFFQNKNTGSTWREANTDLDPEETWMVDFGADFFMERFGTLLRATGYVGTIENIMAYTYNDHPTEPETTLVQTRNIGEAEIYGVEFYVKQPVGNYLSVTGSLTLNHSEITEDKTNPDNEGNQLRNSPNYFGSIGLRYFNPDLLGGEILFRFSDDRYYDDNNTDKPYYHMEEYETVDIKIWRDWKLSNKWMLTTSLSGVNIFDKEYATEIVYVNPGCHIEGAVSARYLF